MSVFHEGEIAVQTRAGVRHQSERVGNGIHAEIPEAAQDFLDRASRIRWTNAPFILPHFQPQVILCSRY